MGFRLHGKNWEGRTWHAAYGIKSLAEEVEQFIDGRPTRSDGTVASKNHDRVSPRSDHRPKPYDGPGVVNAIDITVTPEQGAALTEHLRAIRDSRIKYVIFNRRMFSSYSNSRREAWEWGEYGGANGHITHIHVSLFPASDGGVWGLDALNLSSEREEDEMALKRGDKGIAVKRYQQGLMAWSDNALPRWGADSDFGGETEEWVKHFQHEHDLPETGTVDGVTADLISSYLS